MAIETGLLTEGNGLGNCLHPDSQQAVNDQLHRSAGAARSQIKILSRDHSEDRLGGGEALLISAPEQRQRTLLGNRSASRHGHIEDLNATPGAQSRELQRGL